MHQQRSHELKPAVFLDRDGVINKLVMRSGECVSPNRIEDFQWVDHIQSAVKKLKDLSFFVFVFTNQPDIARKKMSIETLEAMSDKIKKYLSVDEIQVCPHDTHDDCVCRKPRAGMILSLAEKWRVDLASSFVIGDSWKDMEAGKSAGCTTIIIETEYNLDTDADFKVSTILEAVHIIERSGVIK